MLWIGDGALADNLTIDLTDMLRGRVASAVDQRKIRTHFTRTEELLADQLLATLGHEYRDLDEGERQAAVIAVTTTFERAQLTDKQLFRSDLDRLYLYQFVRRFAGDATSGLSEGGIALYDQVLEQCCGYIIAVAGNVPGFQTDAFAELLLRDRQILDRLAEVLAQFPEMSRSQQHASVDSAYRQRIVQAFDRLQLMGLDFAAQWYALSIAYVNLTIGSTEKIDAESFETWLAESPRLVITGRAGSGKTTVLQWLAVRAALYAFTQAAGSLNGRTPFLIKLREYVGHELPPPEQFLDKVAPMLAPKAGSWPRERMESGKALLLVDGVDELPEAQRPKVIDWLRELTELFPDVRYVLTTRPGALDSIGRPAVDGMAQLQELAFAVATLEPMDPLLIRQFVAQWHAAVKDGLADEAARERLAAGEAKLAATIEHDRFLRDLADTPLLAGLICALNQHLKAQLPKRRGEIFETALAMFRQRDLDRGITGPVQLDLAASSHLLGDLALWLMREGATETSEQNARQVIATSSASLPGTPDDLDGLYRHLVLRSGLLREPTSGYVDFVHRTFQEYLAAKSLVASNHIGELVRYAPNDQWREVVILAAGQGNTQQTSELLRGLLGGRLRSPRSGKDRYRRKLLAVACMEEVKAVDPGVLEDVHRVVPELLPPRSTTQAEDLSHVGERLLPLLEQYPPRSFDERNAAIRAAATIGGREALGVIAGLAKGHGGSVDRELERAWLYFDGAEFARDVLEPSGVESLRLTQMSLLRFLPLAPSIRRLSLSFAGQTLPSLRPLDELPLLNSLSLVNVESETLTGIIREWPSLRELALFAHRVREISAIRLLPGLTSLTLSCGKINDPRVLTELAALRSLRLWDKNLEVIGVIPELPNLETLEVVDAGSADLSPLAQSRLKITLYGTEPIGADGVGFLPDIERRPAFISRGSSRAGRVFRRS